MAQPQSITICVTNDLVTDQRVHRIATCFYEAGLNTHVIGRILPNSIALNRPYRTSRLKLLFKKGPLFYANYNLRIFFKLLGEKTELIYSNDLDSLPACYLASILKRKPIIFDSHEYFPEVPELVDRKFVKSFWLAIQGFIVPKLKHCITVSPSIAQLFEQQYGIPFQLIRNVPFVRPTPDQTSIQSTKEKLHISPEKKVILYQGALNVGRGLELVMEAMQYLTDVVFVVIGSGDIEQELKALTQKLNLKEKVIFTGRIPAEEVAQFTLIADLGFSLEEDLGLNYRFALPNKMFDYIQSEVPVVVSNLPDMAAIVQKYNVGEVALDRSAKGIAQCFSAILSNEDKIKQFKENCHIAKQELHWDKEKEVLLEILRSV